MLFVLPLLVYLAILWIVLDRYHQIFDIRILILLASVLWGTLLTFFTEILSLLNRFEFVYLVLVWGLALLIMLGYLFKNKKKLRLDLSILRLDRSGYFQIISILGIVLLTDIIALIAAPNNWDSMVYHMSRVAHWVQNRSVDFYPTSIIRQLYLPPWSEYLIANFQILSGGDRFANIPQWLSMVGSVLGVSLIAKTLGAGKRGQIFSSLVAATIPMGILQSTTTQNDYIVSYWLVCLVSFIFLYRTKKSWILIAGIGMSLGLAALTKSTAYIFALPFVLYLGIWGFRRYYFRFWKQICIITLIFFSLNISHSIRNYDLFQNPLGPQDEVSLYRNEVFTIPSVFSNIIRNIGLYLGSFEPINSQLNKGYELIHHNLDIDLNDPRITWEDHRFIVDTPKVNEDLMGSNLHFLLIVVTVLLLIFG
ncbi:MAG: glycosyltransferase family 39 protein, partial [Anaerolineaceae bacterium]|nr:glycosyltransferase family 39 protein [Anaerolineaceae bacterium]